MGRRATARSAFAVSKAQSVAGHSYAAMPIPAVCPTVKQQIVDMTLNGSGIRDIARVLHVGSNTVIRELKKSRRSLPGQQKRRGGLLSGRDHGRSAARRSR